MRILQMSDLHLEFNTSFRVYNLDDADTLMLNGDIFVADYFTKSEASPKYYLKQNAMQFFAIASSEFERVIYIPGNHEHYHGVYTETVQILKEALAEFPNIHILQNESLDIGDLRVIGTTLWTDCNRRNEATMNYLQGYLNDFRIITMSKEPWARFLPYTSLLEFEKALEFIRTESEGQDNVIVMTHHAPSEKSIHSSYSDPMYCQSNGGYFSHLDSFIERTPQIKLWTHGHMHNSFDYNIGATRVVCNPHGYRSENAEGFNIRNIIDV